MRPAAVSVCAATGSGSSFEGEERNAAPQSAIKHEDLDKTSIQPMECSRALAMPVCQRRGGGHREDSASA